MRVIHNSGKLILFILRRDRFYLPIWIGALVGLAIFFAPLLPDFLGDEQSRAVLTEMMKNPAMVAMIGIPYGDSFGAMFSLFMLVWSAMGACIFNILLVIRHTRKDEEEGRNEIIAALPVGRSANLLAVLLVALAADVAIVLLTAVVIPVFGLEGIDWQGALVYSAAIGVGGFSFAAITALLAQLFATSKSTTVCAFVLLGIAYLIRAFGDMDSSYEVFALISPLGIIERVQAWVSNEYWPLFVLMVESLCLIVVAFVFSYIRDTGAGLFPQRNGRPHASVLLTGAWGLAWRLTRGIFIGWVVVMFILGAAYGSVFNDMASFMDSNVVYATIIGGDPSAQADVVNSFISFLLMLMAVVSTIPVCMVVLKLKSEEKHGRFEQVLAQSVSRPKLMGGFIFIALILSVVLLIATPLGMYVAAASMMESPPALDMMVKASLYYLPAVVAIAGLASALVGALPKATPVVWVFLVYCFLMAYMGNLMASSAAGETLKDVFDVLLKISPFSLLPTWPAHDVDIALSAGMLIVAAALFAVGFVTYRRRDVS